MTDNTLDSVTAPLPRLLAQLGPWAVWLEHVAGLQIAVLTWRGARWGAWALPASGRPS